MFEEAMEKCFEVLPLSTLLNTLSSTLHKETNILPPQKFVQFLKLSKNESSFTSHFQVSISFFCHQIKNIFFDLLSSEQKQPLASRQFQK